MLFAPFTSSKISIILTLFLILSYDLIYFMRHVDTIGYRLIKIKVNIRCISQVEFLRQAVSDKSRSTLKTFYGSLSLLFISKDRNICFAVFKIRSHFDAHDRCKLRYPRILNLSPDHLCKYLQYFTVYPGIFNTVLSHLSGYLYHDVSFYDIKLLHCVKSFKYKSAFKTCFNFLDIIFESLERGKFAFVNLLTLS